MANIEWLVLLTGCKATLILGLVAAPFALLAGRWPQNCRLWQRLGILALLALPVAAWGLPTVGIPVLSSARPRAMADRGEQTILSDPSYPSANTATPVRREILPAAGATLPANRSANIGLQSLDRIEIGRPAICLALAYAVVIVVFMIRLVHACHGLQRLKQDSRVVADPAWRCTLEHWSTVLQVGRRVELRMSGAISVPMTFGWWTPVILIPSDCLSTCDRSMRDAIVVHELTHILHSDFLWQATTQLATTIYWMHPFVWLVRRQDRMLCERICDARCSHHLSRETYAQSLVRIAGRKVFRPVTSLAIGMAHPSSLARRLTDMETSAAPQYGPPDRIQRAFLSGTAGLIFGSILVCALTAGASTEETKNEGTHAPATDLQAAPVESVRLPVMIEGQVADQQGNPIANAELRLCVERANPIAEAAAAHPPWTASTDEQGRYRVQIGTPSLSPDDWLRLKIRAQGFADLSTDFVQSEVQATLPLQRLYTGRTIVGRLVDPRGERVAKAAVRFQASTQDLKMLWDSGPVQVDERGTFSLSIPREGRAAGAIYPHAFAPQIVEVPEKATDLGTIHLERGTALSGHVLDKQGRGVAGTVVGLESEEMSMLFLFCVRIGTAVKTNDDGSFLLPPVRGVYRVLVTKGHADYSRQCYVTGVAPPPTLPRRIELTGGAKTQEIVLREAESVNVRGTVRRTDDSPVADVQITAWMAPAIWKRGVEFGSARTDQYGAYVLRLPASAERVRLSVNHAIPVPDGTFQQAAPVGLGAEAGEFVFGSLAEDREGADWVVGPKD